MRGFTSLKGDDLLGDLLLEETNLAASKKKNQLRINMTEDDKFAFKASMCASANILCGIALFVLVQIYTAAEDNLVDQRYVSLERADRM